jgi:hypothetical protein
VVYLSPGKITDYFVNNVMTAFFQIVSCPSFANRPSSRVLLLDTLTSCDKSQKKLYKVMERLSKPTANFRIAGFLADIRTVDL